MISNVDNKKIILSTKLKEPLKRNENIKEEDISYIQQVSLINQLYMDINTNTKNDITSVIVRELDRKLSGYKQQDIKKEIYDEHFFITYDDIVEMLVVSKLKCHYCRSMMKIIYKVVRDNQQWSLDRIDNDYGHTKENTIICCLKCNLQRRCINKDKFEFTKKIGMCNIKNVHNKYPSKIKHIYGDFWYYDKKLLL
jgi:hypothetical protein